MRVTGHRVNGDRRVLKNSPPISSDNQMDRACDQLPISICPKPDFGGVHKPMKCFVRSMGSTEGQLQLFGLRNQ